MMTSWMTDSGAKRVLRRLLGSFCLMLASLACLPQAWAVNYAFPGALPAGCSGSAGVYTCGTVNLGAGDTITIGQVPTTITFGALAVNNAQINAAGQATDLNIVVTNGLTSVLSGAKIMANVRAGLVSSSGGATFGGNIEATSTYVSLGGSATVGGSIYAQTYVDTGGGSKVTGSITSATSYIDTGSGSTIGGSLSALGTYVDIHGSATVGGSIKAQSYVSMTTNSSVSGNVTARTTVNLGTGSTVARCVRSETSGAITLPGPTAVGGACCGSGSTCGNTCVNGTTKPPACSWPDSALMAEYRFEQTAYTGAVSEVLDSSPNRWHGTMLGGVASTANGRICRGMEVPRNTTSGIQAFDTGIDVNTLGNAGTIAFWYRAVASGSEHRTLFDATTGTNGRFYLYRDDGGTGVDLNFHLVDSGGTLRNVDKLNILSDGVWGHVAVTWRFMSGTGASRMRLYVNGALQDEQTFTVAAINNAIGTLYFGDNRSSASPELNSANGTMDQIKLYSAELAAADIVALRDESPTCTPPAPHHVRVSLDSASGLTCQPQTLTVEACADAACTAPYTGGLSGNLIFSGGPTVQSPGSFAIEAGSASVTVPVHVTTAGAVTIGLSGLSVVPEAGSTPYCGFGATPTAGGSCVFTASDAGLFFDVPHHVSGVSQAVTVSAVRKADNSLACTPAFASVSKTVNFRCSYANPSTGFIPVRVGGAALNAGNNAAAICDGGGRDVALSFNASGVASTSVVYADAGLVGLTATYTGAGDDAGLVMSGSDTFVAAPESFAFTGVTPGPIKAGANFGATVTARNQAGVKAANFGRESTPAAATLSFFKRQPTGAGSHSGIFSGSLGAFNSGEATASNLSWTEVGNADLTATTSNYLGSGLSVTGSTGAGPAGAVGPFVPDHFTVEDVVQGCASGVTAFTYSGQPFRMAVKARNLAGGETRNYDGTADTSPNFAKVTALSAATGGGLGSLGTTSVPASAFSAGAATLTTQTFSFTNKLTAPDSVTVRAVDADGVSSAGKTELGPALRSGRLRLFNAFGTEKASLEVPVQAHYWTGKTWIINSDDTAGCTTVPAASVVRARYLTHLGAATTGWTTSPTGDVTLMNGRGAITLSAPTGGATGTVELAVNLGGTATDQSCWGAHPASTGAQRPWLRALNGSCANTHDRDPSARATFGVFKPETSRAVHAQDVY